MKTELITLVKLNRKDRRTQQTVSGIGLIIVSFISLFIPNENGNPDISAALMLTPMGIIAIGDDDK